MTLENAGYHVDPGEAAVLARRASVASCPRLAAANTSGAAELLLQVLGLGAALGVVGAGTLAVSRVIPLPITYAGLEQLGNCSLIGLEKFPLESLDSLGQRFSAATRPRSRVTPLPLSSHVISGSCSGRCCRDPSLGTGATEGPL